MSLAMWMPLAVKVTDTRYGLMAYYAEDQYIGYCLERYGEYSEAEPQLWRKVVKPGNTALDIGANIGSLTLPLAQMVEPRGKVHAFEAQPENFALLARNCAGLEGVKTWNLAVADESSMIHVQPLAFVGHTNFGGIELNTSNTTGTEVEVICIDDFDDVGRVDFMKIDVEGWELEVIRGAATTIARDRPIMYVENDRPEQQPKLARLLEEIDYTGFPHHPHLCSLRNWKKRPVAQYANTISMNALCVPNERTAEIAKVIFR